MSLLPEKGQFFYYKIHKQGHVGNEQVIVVYVQRVFFRVITISELNSIFS